MTLTELLGDRATASALEVFGAATIEAAQDMLLEKSGKLYVKCQIRNKAISAEEHLSWNPSPLAGEGQG